MCKNYGADYGESLVGVNFKSVSFYGVIIDHTHPRKSKGTDYQTSLTIADETYPEGFFFWGVSIFGLENLNCGSNFYTPSRKGLIIRRS